MQITDCLGKVWSDHENVSPWVCTETLGRGQRAAKDLEQGLLQMGLSLQIIVLPDAHRYWFSAGFSLLLPSTLLFHTEI